MCGIFGAINLTGFFGGDDFDSFVRLTDIVKHRGPDAADYVAMDVRRGQLQERGRFNVFLGHRRLSIIDLSDAGRQPFTDGNGLWIVYNGEIFNYLELRDDLRKKGHTFKTETDTEVVLAVYREYGEAGFALLNGMWAFVIVDAGAGRVIAGRDRFSIKPLYYLKSPTAMYFASEIKQLLPLMDTRRIREDVMVKFLRQGLLDYDEEKTFFARINKVRPKTNLVMDFASGAIAEKRYWNYEEGEIVGDDSAVEKFGELFYDSIRIRLRSDVKVGSLLSGGLDSSAITLVANELSGGKIGSFSVVSHDEKYSEEKFVDILAKERGIKNIKLFFRPQDALEALEGVICTQDEPFGSFSVVAQNLIFKEIKEKTDVTVIFSGQGGDEVLMGYLKYFFFNIRELVKGYRAVEAVRLLLLSLIHRTAVWQFKIGTAKRYVPFLMRRKISYITMKEAYEEIWNYRDLRQRQILDIDKYSIPVLARYEDRNSMANSLEVRHPFLDHRVVNFLVNLPTGLKLKNGWTKYVLRESVKNLPDRIKWRRDKAGFVTPEERWLARDLRGLITETFKNSVLSRMGIIDDKAFMSYYNDFLSGKGVSHYSDVTRVLIAELWARKYCG